MKKVVGYIRVSTIEQAQSGLSLINQQQKIQAYCEALDLELKEIITDAGISAKTLRRPGIEKVIKKVKKNEVDAVVILKLDRLTRNVRDLGNMIELFEKSTVSLISVQDSINTSTAAGKLVLNVLGSVAQWESEAIGERTKAAMKIKKDKCERVGEIPYGYDLAKDGIKLIKNKKEQLILKRIINLRKANISYNKIAIQLRNDGVTTKKGGQWHSQTVCNIYKAVC